MATANTFTKTGNKASSNTTLPKEVFATEVASHALLKQVYEAHNANARSGSAKTKNRSDVRGGGRKPWRQKGTGNARAGSIRSPIWRGGGITFGPTGNENFHKKINGAAKKKALAQALTLKAEAKAVSVIEDIDLKEGKTKELKSLLDKLKFERSVTLVVESVSEPLRRASANLPSVRVVSANYLNVKTVLDSDVLLITKPALDSLSTRLGGSR